MSNEALERLSRSDPSPFGTDVYRSIIDSDESEVMRQAAKLVGLPISIRGNTGEEYSFKHPLEPKMCRGILEKGEVVVEIDYSSNPNIMTEFWNKVKEINNS